MREIVIIGAGDFGKEVAWLIEGINKAEPTYLILGYLDDDEDKINIQVGGYTVLGKVSYLKELTEHHDLCASIAMQDVDRRERIVNELSWFNRWETLIHPSVDISDRTKLGEGCVVCAGVNVSVDTVIGKHCLFNISSTIGHDCVIGDYVSVMSGAKISGHVKVGNKAYLATNCTVVPGKKIGEHSTVGAGSVALRDVKEGITVMGVPAKKIMF